MRNPELVLRGGVAWGRLAGECFTKCVWCSASIDGMSRRRFCGKACCVTAYGNTAPIRLERCRCDNCGKRFFSRGGPIACDWRCMPSVLCEHTCSECGVVFQPHHHSQRTCSNDCSRSAYDRSALKKSYPWANRGVIDMCILRRRYIRATRYERGDDVDGTYRRHHGYLKVGPNRFVVPGRGVISRQRISQLRAAGALA